MPEYIGNIPAEKREEIVGQLNREMERLIQVGGWVGEWLIGHPVVSGMVYILTIY